jgi:hypothetical protein
MQLWLPTARAQVHRRHDPEQQQCGEGNAHLFGNDPRTRVLEHRQRVERNVGPRERILRGREVVGVGLAGDLEDRHRDLLRNLRRVQEPLRRRPRLHHLLSMLVASLRLVSDIVLGVEHEQRL